MKNFEVILEFGSFSKQMTRIVEASDEKHARKIVWETLSDNQKDVVSDIEVIEIVSDQDKSNTIQNKIFDHLELAYSECIMARRFAAFHSHPCYDNIGNVINMLEEIFLKEPTS